MKSFIVFGIIGIICLLIFASVVLATSDLGFRWLLAPFRGAVEKQEIVHQGAYRIQAYEQFYRWQEQIDGIDTKLSAYPLDLDTRQQTECQGLLSRRANLVASYNSASRAETTQGRWLDSELPQILPQQNPRRC